jgi:acetylornithine deacetylase
VDSGSRVSVDIERLLADLISIDSTNPDLGDGAGEFEIATFVVHWLGEHGVDAVTHDTGIDNRPNVIGRVVGGDGPALMLNAHLDTVGIGGHIDPFIPRIDGRRMYGRGSMDTKGGLAAMMTATARAAESGVNGTVLFTGVADEEFASFGTEAIVRDFVADAAIVAEPSHLGVTIAHKGFEWFEVEVVGFAAHGSMPDIGVDAIVKMGKVLVAIDALGARLASGHSHPLLGPGSIHASLIEGGQETSSYPRSSLLTIERRTIPGETTGSTTAELQSILDVIAAGDQEFDASLRHTMSRSPYEIPEGHPFAELVCISAETVLGRPPEITGHSGWMDTAVLGAAGIPCVVLGPIGDGLHGDIEWVDLGSVRQMADIVTDVVHRFCG